MARHGAPGKQNGNRSMAAGILRILILSDGRPGHYRQSEAIAAALARRRTTAVEKVELPFRKALPRALLSRLARWLPPHRYLQIAHGRSEIDFPVADLIVSAGVTTLGASVALKQLRGAPNVFAGSLRGVDPLRVSLTLLPYARARDLPNHACLLKPAMIDPDALPAPRPWPGLSQPSGYRIGVLIGGPTAAAAFTARDWDQLARFSGELSAAGFALSLATAPRTPPEAYAALAALAGSVESKTLSFIDYRRAGPGSNASVFACDAVLVTLDSMSMITEAVAARRPAVALTPAATRPTPDSEAVAALAASDHLRLMPLEGASPAGLAEALATISPIRDNHLDVLADTILARIKL